MKEIEKGHFLVLISIVAITGFMIAVSATVDQNRPWHPLQQISRTQLSDVSVDENQDGIIDEAEEIPWSGITGIPSGFADGKDDSVPSGVIVMWSGSAIPDGWALCDGTKGTPDLRNKFIVAAGAIYSIGDTGGESAHRLKSSEIPLTGVKTSILVTKNSNPFWKNRFGYESYGACVPPRNAGGGYNDCIYPKGQVEGGDQPHENRPPYYALAYIMKLEGSPD